MKRPTEARGAIFLAMGLALLVLAAVLPGAGVIAFAGGLGVSALGGWIFASSRSAARVNRAVALVGKGALAEAETELSGWLWPWLGGVPELLRGTIAFERGDVAAALVALDAGVKKSSPRSIDIQSRANAILLRSLRAYVRAVAGDTEGAHADVGVVRREPGAHVAALAQATLGEALLLARAGDKEGLRAILAARRDELYEGGSARVRALARGLARFARATQGSTYRTAPGGDAASDLHRWTARLLPELLPFIDVDPVTGEPFEVPRDAAPAPRPRTEPTAASPPPAPKPPMSLARRALLLWGALIVLFSAVWQIVGPSPREAQSPAPRPPPPPTTPSILSGGIPMLVVVVVATIFVVYTLRKQLALGATLQRASRDASLGRAAEAEAAVLPLTTSRMPAIAASARLIFAETAARRADFTRARTFLDEALPLAERAGAGSEFLLLPALFSTRAAVRAALGDDAGARADIRVLDERFPDAVHRGTAGLVVDLRSAVLRGDWTRAAETAERRKPSTTLPYRDDLLADLALVIAGNVRDPLEVARLADEVRDDEAVTRWIDTIAPGARAALERAAVTA